MASVLRKQIDGQIDVAESRQNESEDYLFSSITKSNSLSIVPVLFVISLIIPIFFYAGPLRLPPSMLLLLFLIFPMLGMLLVRSAGPFILPDFLIIFSCFWTMISLLVIHGLSEAIEPLGVVWVQTLGAYLVGRIFVRNLRTLRAVLISFLVVIFLLLPFSIYEALTGQTLYLNLMSYLAPTVSDVVMDTRWGIHRVQAAFEHPILFGVFSCSLFSLAFYGIKNLVLRGGALAAIVLSTCLSLSTGALLCLTVQCGLISWNWFFRGDRLRWRKLTILLAVGYVVVDFLSNRSPFHVFVSYMTFSSGSAYNRILIWNYGSAEVWRHPIFGIGLEDWVRPAFMSSSMDNFWLVVAVRYGIPAFLALSVALFVVLRRAGSCDTLDPVSERYRNGLVMSIVGVMVAICSVHLWNATYCWFLFLVGSSVFFIQNGGVSGAANPIGSELDTKMSSKDGAKKGKTNPVRTLRDVRASRSINHPR